MKYMKLPGESLVNIEMDTMTHSKSLPLACIPGQP